MLNEILNFLNDKESVKILVNVDDSGLPHPAVKGSLRSEDGNIIYTEVIESSNTNRFLNRALWLNKKVSILLITSNKRSFKIVAQPTKAIVSGKVFQKYYEEVQNRNKNFDLSTVWIFKPLEIVEQKSKRGELQKTLFLHLDRLAKES